MVIAGFVLYGQVDTVNIGAAANDGTGDNIRTAFIKVNANDIELETNARIDSIRIDQNDNHRNTTGDAHSTEPADIGALPAEDTTLFYDVAMILTDTFCLAFTVGVTNVGDSIAFQVDNVIAGKPVKGSYNYIVREFGAVAVGTSPDVDLMLQYHTEWNHATPTEVLSGDLNILSTTTGNSTTSFANATIPKGSFLFVTVEESAVKPTQLEIWVTYSLTR